MRIPICTPKKMALFLVLPALGPLVFAQYLVHGTVSLAGKAWAQGGTVQFALAENYGVEVAQGYLIDPDGIVRALNPRIVNLGKWVSVPAESQLQKDTE